MKLKKITAAVLAAVLVAANMSVTGFAGTGAPKLTFLNDAADGLKQRSNLTVTVASGNGSGPVVSSPSDSDKESGNVSGSDADKNVSAGPGRIVFPNELGADMEIEFKTLLESDRNKNVLLDIAEAIAEKHRDEIVQLFQGENVDEIKVFIEIELNQVEMEGDNIQYVRYSVTPKAYGSKKDGSSSELKELSDIREMGSGNRIPLAIPESYIAEDAKEGVFIIRDGIEPCYAYMVNGWFFALYDDLGGFGEAVIVPSRYNVVDQKYYHGKGDEYWVGIESLPRGTSVRMSFDGYPFDEVEYGREDAEYIDCRMGSDSDSVIITGIKSTEGAFAEFYLVRKLKGGLELKIPFSVKVVDAPQNSGSSSSSDEGGSYSASSPESEPSGGWVAGEKGWWYRFKDGTYPSNGWKLLVWQGKTSWYYFGAEGYMVSGWLTDTDGNRYFLHDKLDGTQGYMYTGWHEIDGKWYYFSEAEGGPLGSLLVDATTPDGYQVGADGVWIP